MPSEEARRLAQAMQNSLSQIPGKDGQVWRLTYRSDGKLVFNTAQVANVLDGRPSLDPGNVDLHDGGRFTADVLLTRDLRSLAESIPVWIVVEADFASGRWYLADIDGPMTMEQAGLSLLEVNPVAWAEELYDPVERNRRSAADVVREIMEDPLEVIAESPIPAWVWALGAVGVAVSAGPTVLEAIRTFRS